MEALRARGSTNPLDAVIWDKAGERVMTEAAARAESMPGGAAIQLYKNNTDNKRASYRCHENYLMSPPGARRPGDVPPPARDHWPREHARDLQCLDVLIAEAQVGCASRAPCLD